MLSINVHFKNSFDQKEVNFYASEEWTSESENHFVSNIGEILTILRGEAPAIELKLNVFTNDVSQLTFLLNKKRKKLLSHKKIKLSPRESEVLGMIMLGLTNKNMAEKLAIGLETVKYHRKNILMKTGSKNTASLLNLYHTSNRISTYHEVP